MATGVIMPRQGQSVESCILNRLNVKEGDVVKEGDILFEYETDKASFEEEAKEAGTVLAILAEEGDDIPCLETVLVIGNEGDDISEFQSAAKEEAEKENAKDEIVLEDAADDIIIESAQAPDIEIISVDSGDGVFASPRAKALAKEMNVDYTLASATGAEGRIIEADIIKLANEGVPAKQVAAGVPVATAAAVAETEYEDIPHSNVRKVIAKSMHSSLQNSAQLTLNASFDMASMNSYRRVLKEKGEALGLPKITINDMILFAVSRVIKDFKEFNAHYDDEKLRIFNSVNLGMAVDTPRGLLVPTIFGSDKLSLSELSAATKDLGAQAVEGKISPDLLSGATFTISNLGSLGIESFTPVINPPQVGILGVNTMEDRIKVIDGEVVPYKAMTLSLTFDHRAVDGADAGRFLQSLCKHLESFKLIMAK